MNKNSFRIKSGQEKVSKDKKFNTFYSQAQSTTSRQNQIFQKLDQNRPFSQGQATAYNKQFLNNKNITNITNSEALEIVPREVVIKDIQQNQIYEVIVSVRNLSKNPRRIRITQPQTSKFRCDYDMQDIVAAGMSLTLVVMFETNFLDNFHDVLRIYSEMLDYHTSKQQQPQQSKEKKEQNVIEYKIPLHAFMSKPEITFDNFINFGFVKIHTSKIQELWFQNDGSRLGKIELKIESPVIIIEPHFFQIEPGEKKKVDFKYTPNETGIFRGTIDVDIKSTGNESANGFYKTIDINATSVEFTKFLIDKNGVQISQVDFGNMYLGQTKEQSAFLVNNTPNFYKYIGHIRSGLHNLEENDAQQEAATMLTPMELGQEQAAKIMSIFPAEGTIRPYSQIPIKFQCASKISYECQAFTVNYSLQGKSYQQMMDDIKDKLEPNFEYSVLFDFVEKKETDLKSQQQSSKQESNQPPEEYTIVHLRGKGYSPQVMLQQSVLSFGECPMNQFKDILINIENKNEELSINYSFKKVPHFFIRPSQQVLSPGQKSSFIVTFAPKNLGKFSSIINLVLLNNQYEIPIKVSGFSDTIAERETQKKGPECLPIDYERSQHFIDQDKLMQQTVFRKKKSDGLVFQPQEKSVSMSLPFDISVQSDNADQFYIKKYNQEKYEEFLKLERKRREVQSREKQVTKRLEEEKALLAAGQLKEKKEYLKEENEEDKAEPPYDFAEIYGLGTRNIDSPRLGLPNQRDPLFVKRPIDKYEPMLATKINAFSHNPDIPIKKKFPQKPQSQIEAREIKQELTSEQLQKIQVCPNDKKLDFDSVYIKSSVTKTFAVQNNLRSSIVIRLEVENDELKGSYLEPQIIPSSSIAGFEVVFHSKSYDAFKGVVRYWINEKHQFSFAVNAKVDPVKLLIKIPGKDGPTNTIQFKFAENNKEMYTEEIIKVVNNGNAPGKFKWEFTEKRLFTVLPEEGEVPGMDYQTQQPGEITCKIRYNPSENAASSKNGDEEKLFMDVIDGDQQTIKCVGYVQDSKCQILEKSVELGSIPICKREERRITIKNTYKFAAVYQVGKLPPYTKVYPEKDRLGPDQSKILTVVFADANREEVIKDEIRINIRGKPALTIPFSVSTIIPKVYVSQEEFDFGEVTTLGNSGTLPMTIINDSDIKANLILDLREKDDNAKEYLTGLDCLEIFPIKDNALDESSFMKSISDRGDDENFYNKEEDIDQNKSNSDADSEEEDGEQKESTRYYRIQVKPLTKLQFNLKFSPKDVINYQLQLPLTLQNYGNLQGLQRQILCKGLSPQFLMEPKNLIQFDKKTIISPDKCVPFFQEITISNPEPHKSITWKFDQTELKLDNVFEITPSEGRLDGNGQKILKVSFNPLTPGKYEKIVNVYINGQTKPYMSIELKGIGAFPRLVFDRREIILPVVPLNIWSRCLFRVINEGYDNLNLKYNLIQEEGIRNFKLELDFIEGQTLDNVTKKQVRIEVKFMSDKPVSFTTKLQFYDDSDQYYNIMISGTADNCLISNFPYMQRNQDDFKIKAEENKPIMLTEEEDDDEDSSKQKTITGPQGQTISYSRAASVVSGKSSKSMLGYNPIPQGILERSCEAIVKWLSQNCLNQPIFKFPSDIITQNGNQIFEMIQYLSGRTLNYKAKIETNMKKADKIKAIVKQYDDLIRHLKGDGALLNTIRPHYLLDYNDFSRYIQMTADNNLKTKKIFENRFNYLSIDSWITLFYQITKIYFLARVNLKVLRNLPKQQTEVQVIPNYYLETSNLFSQQEIIILRWLELNHELLTAQEKGRAEKLRLSNFSSDMRDCRIYASAIQNYVGHTSKKTLSAMKNQCSTEEDYKFNAEKIMGCLANDIGLQTYFTQMDLYMPSQRESILFVMTLMHTLPHYIPKGGPVVFPCSLQGDVTKIIEITNPTNRPISYWVKLEKFDPHADFSCEQDQIKLEPKGQANSICKFKIKYHCRISKTAYGRITFRNKKDGNAQAAALVFDLQSECIERKSIQTLEIKSKLYQQKELKVKVINIFDQDAEFTIKLEPVENLEAQEKLNASKKAKEAANQKQQKNKQNQQASKKKGDGQTTEGENKMGLIEEQHLIPAFFCSKDKIKVKKNDQNQIVSVQFMPMLLENVTYRIIFCDTNVGEFQYDLVGITEMPEYQQQEIRPPFTVYVDVQKTYEHIFNYKNEQIKKAIKEHDDRLVRAANRQKEHQAYKAQKKALAVNEQCVYDVQLQPLEEGLPSPYTYIQVPPQITLYDKSKIKKQIQGSKGGKDKDDKDKKDNSMQDTQQQPGQPQQQQQQQQQQGQAGQQQQQPQQQGAQQPQQKKKDKGDQSQQGDTLKGTSDQQLNSMGTSNLPDNANKMNVTFNFKQPAREYQCNLVLKNQSKSDVRIFKLCLQVCPKKVEAKLEMKVPAGDEIKQEIPVVNNMDKDWVMKITLEQDTTKYGNVFFGQKDFVAKKKQTSYYTVTFRPPWILQATGKLSIFNSQTQDLFEYDLIGVGEEPLAKDHIILNCIARKPITREIEIENFNKEQPISYKVESDLMNPQGLNHFSIPPGKIYKYPLTITPILGGLYTGSITFFQEDDEQRYFWYTIMVNTERPKSERSVDLVTMVRKAAAFDIQLVNPLKEMAIFEVAIEGEGLIGSPTFTIQPNQSAVYELLFSPLRPLKCKGSVAFMHEKLGEIWYELNLHAEENPVIRLPTMKSELGKYDQQEVFLENPSGNEVRVYYRLSNSNNFDVIPDTIYIPPYSQQSVFIRYTPSDLDINEAGEVWFESEEIGKWHYMVYGMGLPPTKFDEKVIHGSLNKDFSSTINFKNPFKDSINITISLEIDEKFKNAFQLLLKKLNQTVTALSSLQIPYSFTPKEISEYRAEVIIFMSEKIQWKYPLRGITEAVSTDVIYSFKTKCRVPLEDQLQISLPGVPKDFQNQTFTLDFDNIPNSLKHSFNKMFKIESALEKKINVNQDIQLLYNVKFQPMKPIKQTLDLVITISNGGRWKFRLQLEATEPDEDDTIVIYSPLNRTSSISFKLSNKDKHSAPFTAHFTSDSDPEFSVMPKSGDLPPKDREGQNFIVSFTPVEYGKAKNGKLIIQTDDLYWSYIVRGTFPKYRPPSGLQTKLNNRLDPIIEEQLNMALSKKKNFMSQNIKQSRIYSPYDKSRMQSQQQQHRKRSPKQSPKAKTSSQFFSNL